VVIRPLPVIHHLMPERIMYPVSLLFSVNGRRHNRIWPILQMRKKMRQNAQIRHICKAPSWLKDYSKVISGCRRVQYHGGYWAWRFRPESAEARCSVFENTFIRFCRTQKLSCFNVFTARCCAGRRERDTATASRLSVRLSMTLGYRDQCFFVSCFNFSFSFSHSSITPKWMRSYST